MFSSPKDLRHHNTVHRSLSCYLSSVSAFKIQVAVGCHKASLWKNQRISGKRVGPCNQHIFVLDFGVAAAHNFSQHRLSEGQFPPRGRKRHLRRHELRALNTNFPNLRVYDSSPTIFQLIGRELFMVNQVALVSESKKISLGALNIVSAAIQKQVSRDLGPIWNIQASVNAFDKLEDVPLGYWQLVIMDKIPYDAAGIHLNRDNGQPFAWSSTPTIGHSLPATKLWKCWLTLPAIAP